MTRRFTPPDRSEPPYGHRFLAELHAGCFDDDTVGRDPSSVRETWAEVRSDKDAAEYLDSLDALQCVLRRIGSRLGRRGWDAVEPDPFRVRPTQ